MSWFVASDQFFLLLFLQLFLLQRRHKVEANLQCTDEAQNQAEIPACT